MLCIYLCYGNNCCQQVKVTGTVVSLEDNQPLPGVNIRIGNTNTGTTSDVNGKYALTIDDPNAKLVFSFIGYITEEVEIGGRTVIDITLSPDISQLEEVVVIGYGSTAKRNVASATTALKSNEIVGLSTNDIRQTMQGKIAGVQVTNNSGDPGAGARIVIRGMGSFSNTDPLYVIDGIQGGDINSIAPQDIENITILKDASTTAIYGSAAANGVVLITTKSGVKGNVKVSYDGSVGIAKVTKRLDLLKASDYVDLVADIQEAGGLSLTEKLESEYAQVDRTDWQEEVFQSAVVTEHNLRLSGGTENVTYAFSTGYQNQGSTVIDRNFQRITFGAKLSEDLFNRKLRLNQNLRIKNETTDGVLANFNDALRMPPYIPVKDPDNLGGYGRADKVTDLNDANNPWNSVENTDYKRRGLNADLDLSAELTIFSGLSFKSQARLSAYNSNDYTFNYPSDGGNFTRSTSDMSENYSQGYDLILENFFNFSRVFGNHDVSATLGNTYDPSSLARNVSVAGSNFTSDAIQNVALANSTSLTGAGVNSGYARSSYFGRIGYTFREKYVINASLRRDASSKFGENNRWGTFYGLGLAWTISKENFMSSISSISNLKLRASYGKTGNDLIPAFLTSSTVWKGSSNNIIYSFGDDLSYTNGSTVNSIANPDLKWEETNQFDIGLDLGLLSNSLNFVFDYFYRNNEDLLIETQLPLTTGLGNPGSVGTQWVNAAGMKNSGFEAAISYARNTGELTWDVSVNTTFSTNEVTALGTIGDVPISSGEFVGGVGNTTRTDIGQPLAAYYGYKFDHVVASQTELDALNASAVAASGGAVTEYKVGMLPGDRVWKDTDGNGYIDDKDRTYIGNPSPKWQYGAQFNANYKNFDFQLLLHGIAGVDLINGALYWWEGMSKPFNNTTEVLNRWKQDGDVTDMPAAGQNSSANLFFSDWYVENGAYLRIKNISLGYTLPVKVLNGAFDKFRVYVAVQNALTLTQYTGYDPEVSSNSPDDNRNYIFSRGVDLYQRPNPRIVRLGLQLNF
ncbi:MAG: TonB-dependent receptor [Bacteroidales bacterium]|nr:TonB-dependent receptor [Bacteroidales bacterium]